MSGDGAFDEILVHLGTGRWNFLYFFVSSYVLLMIPPQYLSGVYIAPSVNYTCLLQDAANSTTISGDQCSYMRRGQPDSEEDEAVVVPCSKWDIQDDVFNSTVTSEFELVCSRDHQRMNYQAIYFIGTLIGQYIAGYLADRFGRKAVIVISKIGLTSAAVGMAFFTNFTAILAVRFIAGALFLQTEYVLALEVCEPKYRSIVGILIGLPWGLGTILWGCIAYLIRDWRSLQLAVSVPIALSFFLIYFMDESPRWLIVRGHHEKALKVLKRAAAWNKSHLPPDDQLLKLMKDIELQSASSSNKVKPKEGGGGTDGEDALKTKSLKSILVPRLFSTRRIGLITLKLCFDFCVLSLVFDGMNLSGDIYSDDIFMYIILQGLVEVPSYTFTAPITARWGRKRPIVTGYLVSGVSILALAFIPPDISWLVMLLAFVGKMSNTAAYQIIYLYANELLPTEVRSQGFGLACFCQQIVSTTLPYLTAYVGTSYPWVISVIFGGTSLMAGAVTLTLAETLNVPLPDTIADLQRPSERKKKNHQNEGPKTPVVETCELQSQDVFKISSGNSSLKTGEDLVTYL